MKLRGVGEGPQAYSRDLVPLQDESTQPPRGCGMGHRLKAPVADACLRQYQLAEAAQVG